MKQKVFFKTFGCRTNIFDTQVMINNLQDFEVVEAENEADIVVINSCTVTNSADSSAKNYVNSLKKLPNEPRIFFTGCGVWTKGEQLFEQNKIDSLFGHSNKEKINEILKSEKRVFEPGNLEHLDKTIVTEFVGKSRAFIKIQEGCDFRCSYCIIPFVRGDARSYTEETIANQVEILAENGFGEFVLTGTNIGSYGKKSDSSLAKLLKKLSQVKGVRRIRLGSIEPVQIDDEFKELLDEPWMAKHLHIALQHTNKEMLKLMNRRNKVLDDLELFEFIAGKNYAIGTDFIVGHPGETSQIWEDALANFKNFPITHLHCFTYSKRDGTPSAAIKHQINGAIAKDRLWQLEEIVAENNYTFRQKKQPLNILVESFKDGVYNGFDQYFNKIEIESETDLVGDWVGIYNYEAKKWGNIAKF